MLRLFDPGVNGRRGMVAAVGIFVLVLVPVLALACGLFIVWDERASGDPGVAEPTSVVSSPDRRAPVVKPGILREMPATAKPSLAQGGAIYGAFLERATGDLDVLIERRTIRALVVFSRTHFFLDGGRQRGIAYETMESFERFINRSQPRGG